MYRLGFFNEGNNCGIIELDDFENRVSGKSLAQKHKPNVVLRRCRLELFIVFYVKLLFVYKTHGCDNRSDVFKLFLAIPSPIQ